MGASIRKLCVISDAVSLDAALVALLAAACLVNGALLYAYF